MNDFTPIKPVDDLQYNEKGVLMSPQPKGWGVLLACSAPIIALLDKWTAPFPSLFLQKTWLFKVMIFHFHMSPNQVANFEFLLWLLLLFEVGSGVWFFCTRAAKYSRENPPSTLLKWVWPRQFIAMTMLGVVFLYIPFLVGVATHAGWLFDESIDPKMTKSMLFVISIGLAIAADGAASGALWTYCYLKYWRQAD